MAFYNKIQRAIHRYSKHKLSLLFLACFSFTESIFMPIPTDIMIFVMSAINRAKFALYALVAGVASGFGGIVAYSIGGYIALNYGADINNIIAPHYMSQVEYLYSEYGLMALFIAAVTPLPYKVFALASGYMSVNIINFIAISFISRTARYMLVALLASSFAKINSNKAISFVNYIALAAVAICLLGYYLMKQ